MIRMGHWMSFALALSHDHPSVPQRLFVPLFEIPSDVQEEPLHGLQVASHGVDCSL